MAWVSAYALACGAKDTRERGDNHLTLEKEHGVYHVKGWIDDIHCWESFDTVKEARSFMRRKLKG